MPVEDKRWWKQAIQGTEYPQEEDAQSARRALAKAVLRENVDPTNAEAVTNIAREITLKDVQDPDLRGEEIAAIASKVAVIEGARKIFDQFQIHAGFGFFLSITISLASMDRP